MAPRPAQLWEVAIGSFPFPQLCQNSNVRRVGAVWTVTPRVFEGLFLSYYGFGHAKIQTRLAFKIVSPTSPGRWASFATRARDVTAEGRIRVDSAFRLHVGQRSTKSRGSRARPRRGASISGRRVPLVASLRWKSSASLRARGKGVAASPAQRLSPAFDRELV